MSVYRRFFSGNYNEICVRLGKGFVRRKQVDEEGVEDTKLERCLTTLDLTALGIGSTLGAGIYVVAGEVAKATAGPSVVLSFLIAAIASVLAGLCYAEFGARVPKTGSAYVYSYVSVGELMAFVIGWNLILEYVIGTASVARAWSANFDALINKTISKFFDEHFHMNQSGLAEYPDFFAFLITLLLTIILAIGVKESSTFNKIFTGVNLCVVTYVIVSGLFKVDIANWQVPPVYDNDTEYGPKEVGAGGFFPFGIAGTLSGAGTCFYAFVGFDAIATTGEEVKNPQKAIPISICLCLLACFLAYFGISAVMTLMCPYYLLDKDAPLPFIFSRVDWHIAKYVIAVGAVCGLSTSLLGAMFPLPRVIYAMASDGLIFRFLARINQRFKTPLIATILSGLLAGSMACLFDLKELVDMMSIGTLLAYTLVAVSVLILRGRVDVYARTPSASTFGESATPGSSFVRSNESTVALTTAQVGVRNEPSNPVTFRNYLRHFFKRHSATPTRISQFVTACNTYLLLIVVFIISIIFVQNNLNQPEIYVPGAFFLALYVLLLISIAIQPENKSKITFKVPLVPFLPGISMLINIYLMMKLPTSTWYRFFVWMALGFMIYFGYGICHSNEGKSPHHRNFVEERAQMELNGNDPDVRDKLIGNGAEEGGDVDKGDAKFSLESY